MHTTLFWISSCIQTVFIEANLLSSARASYYLILCLYIYLHMMRSLFIAPPFFIILSPSVYPSLSIPHFKSHLLPAAASTNLALKQNVSLNICSRNRLLDEHCVVLSLPTNSFIRSPPFSIFTL